MRWSRIQDLYFGGDMEAAIPLTGEVCGRIDAVLTAEQIISQTMGEFQQLIQDLARRYRYGKRRAGASVSNRKFPVFSSVFSSLC
jgi:hypothetical protein